MSTRGGNPAGLQPVQACKPAATISLAPFAGWTVGAQSGAKGCLGLTARFTDAFGHRRGRIHRLERGRGPQRGRAERHRRQRRARRRRQVAQSRASGRWPTWSPPTDLLRWLDGRKLDAVIHMGAISDTTATDADLVHGDQLPAVARLARLVHASPRRRSSMRRRPRPTATARGLFRRLVAGCAAGASADESLRLEQASVRSRGGRARRARSRSCRRNGPA